MYDKIYRNMLILITLTLVITILTVSLGVFTVFTSNIDDSLSEDAKRTATLLSSSDNVEKIIEKLNLEESGYTYKIINQGENFKPDASCYYSSAEMDGGKTLIVSLSRLLAYSPIYTPLIFIIVIGVLMYFLLRRFASALAESIVKPFSDGFIPDDTYDEILPLTRAIEYQTKEIKRQTENAEAREVELKLITDSMNEGLIIVDEKGNILSINDFALRLFRAEAYNVRNRHFSTLLDSEAFSLAICKALDNNRSNALIELGDSVYRVYCSPVRKDGIPVSAIIMIFDITSTYQSEKLRREFSSNVSHELKTPLTSINGYAQIISGGIAKADDIPGFAEKIAKESNRLMILIEDIMRLSKLDEEVPEELDSVISVKEIVTETISSLMVKAEERNISIEQSGADFSVTANKTQLSELIYNICDNAIKYNKENGSVMVTLSDNFISISDTGIGIPPEYTDRIFERFFRVDKSHSKKVDGTGLGLSIVKHIARRNGIEISVKSTLGEGSTFIVRFK